MKQYFFLNSNHVMYDFNVCMDTDNFIVCIQTKDVSEDIVDAEKIFGISNCGIEGQLPCNH